MDCDQIREALSAGLDDEDPGMDHAVIDHHVEGCSSCAAWLDDLRTLHRVVRIRAAEEIPDLTAAILDTAAPASVSRRRPWFDEGTSTARWALFTVPLTQVPDLEDD